MVDSNLRVAIVTYNRPDCNCGGIEDHLYQLIKGLSGKGFTFYVFYAVNKKFEKSRDELSKYCKPIGIHCSFPEDSTLFHPLRKVEFNLRLYRIVKRSGLDIIQLNGDNGLVPRKSPVISVQYGATTIRKVLKFGGDFWIKGIPRLLYSLPSIFFELYGISMSREIVIDNDTTLDFMNRFFSRKKISLIYDLIDVEKFKPVRKNILSRQIFNMKDDRIYAIWVSSSIEKGLADALKAIKRTRRTHLLVVGISSDDKDDKVTYLGHLSHEQLATYMSLSDYFILPTRKRAIDLAVIDAISCGLVPVLYKSAYSFLFKEEQAFLADNLDDLESIVMKIDDNPKLLAMKNPKGVSDRFLPDRILSAFSEVYRNVLSDIKGDDNKVEMR